ncbi:MOSC domain-containing protein [Actinoallomurus sp. CA-150999]|uniref:MOSC domain-containing protein n=1 Tax=Actinoallomurus sp. CA-150999 TaxID=3239887 RepID=UPI003D912708
MTSQTATSTVAVDRDGVSGRLTAIYKYPIKGLSPQKLDRAEIVAGSGIPGDRRYALARPHGAYRPGLPHAVSKQEYFMLARDARLAGLSTTLASDGCSLTVKVREHVVFEADLSVASGRRATERFFGRVLGCDEPDMPVLAQEEGRRFTDISVVSFDMMEAVSLINLATVRALEEKWGAAVDPLRFRANLYIDLDRPFVERDLLGVPIQVGPVRMTVVRVTKRCAATEVNPANAARDLPIPRLLVEHYGDAIMGVYAKIDAGGTLEPGQLVRVGE